MKIHREARASARRLFRLCAPQGQLDEERTRAVIQQIIQKKPRYYFQVLSRLKKLIQLAIAEGKIEIDSAIELRDQGEALFQSIEKKYGRGLEKTYRVRPELIGGLRIQRGSDVWDGSVRGRLQHLQNQFPSS